MSFEEFPKSKDSEGEGKRGKGLTYDPEVKKRELEKKEFYSEQVTINGIAISVVWVEMDRHPEYEILIDAPDSIDQLPEGHDVIKLGYDSEFAKYIFELAVDYASRGIEVKNVWEDILNEVQNS